MYRKTKINVYVVWIFTCRRKRRSRGSNFQHSRAPDFSVKLNFLHFFHIFTIATISAALCGSPAHVLCGTSSHTNVMSSAGQHTYSSQLNSWNSPASTHKLTFLFTRPKARPQTCGQLVHTHTKCGFPQQQVRELLKIDETFFLKLRYGLTRLRSISALNFLLFEKIFILFIVHEGKK